MSEVSDADIINQENRIREEMLSNAPAIGQLMSPLLLLHQYENAYSQGFVTGIKYLGEKYDIRCVRGDGNCFYRAFLFSYLEELLINREEDTAVIERTRLEDLLKSSMAFLTEIGYSEMAIEPFYDALIELIKRLFTLTRDDLLAAFQDGGEADYYTWYMRAITAGVMKRQPDRFLPFIDDGITVDIDSYVQREVEPMGKECEQIHILCLTEFFGVVTKIEYLDGRDFDASTGLASISFGEDSPSPDSAKFVVTLLYRPGHYDILYNKASLA